jgi:probable rRNA maturation factor
MTRIAAEEHALAAAKGGIEAEGSGVDHEISLSVEEPFVVDEAALLRAARAVLDAEVGQAAAMSIVITDDETVRALNREFRGYDEPTDVLSFGLSERMKPAAEGEEFFPFPNVPDEPLHLGEVVISHPTAERQAIEHSRPVIDELCHLLIHGALHLLGYDHAEPVEEASMRAREQELLAASEQTPK